MRSGLRNILLLFLFNCLAVGAIGQMASMKSSLSKLSIFGGGGMMYYVGDMKETPLPNFSSMGWNVSLGIKYKTFWRFYTSAHINYGYILGGDRFSTEEARRNRNLYFQSNIFSGDVRLSMDFVNTENFFFTPYGFAGTGVFHFNPKAEDGTELQPLGTEGQYAQGDNLPKPYKLWQFTVPYGVGLRFRFKCRYSLKVELCYHKTFTDYLDDASNKFVDVQTLATSPNPSQTIKYADMRKPGPTYNSRGNPKKDDNYIEAGIYFEVKLGYCRAQKKRKKGITM